MTSETYKSALVTFLDVLGFRALVTQRGASELAAVLGRFERHCAPHFRMEAEALSYFAFSDTIVRISPLRESDSAAEIADRLITEVSDVVEAQGLLCQKGIVVRGAISLGDIWAEPGRIFGPALIRSYELENTKAKYPRVIVDPNLISCLGLLPLLNDPDPDYEEWPSDMMELYRYLAVDADGCVFVDYLAALQSLGDDGTEDAMVERGILYTKHRSVILEGLRSSEPRVVEKYEWLSEYHNRRVPADFAVLRL